MLTKSVSSDTVAQGQPFSYTLEITNNGPDAVPGFSVWDAFPHGVAFSDFSPQQTEPCAEDTLCWQIETPLLQGEKITITYTGRGVSNLTKPQTKINVAGVTSEHDSNPGNDSDSDSVVCLPIDSCDPK